MRYVRRRVLAVARQYTYNLGVLASIAFNVVFLLGSPHESTSMRVARMIYVEKTEKKHWIYAGSAINWIFRVINNEDNHLLDALDGEDNARELRELKEI